MSAPTVAEIQERAANRNDGKASAMQDRDDLLAALATAKARAERLERLAEHGYWYYLMTIHGGPDGSDLDDAVQDDFLASLRGWADAEHLPALPEPLEGPITDANGDELERGAPDGVPGDAP